MNLDFTIFPIINTERLTLRSLSEQDAELIHQLQSDPVINAFVGRENNSSLESAQAYVIKIQNLVFNNECIYWVISSKIDNKLIGTICCWNFDNENEIVEIGYEMLPEFQGKGFMTEALQGVITYSFNEMQAKLITAFPSADNSSSVTLLKKLNFIFENEAYNNKHENVKNITTYTLRKEDFSTDDSIKK